MISGPGSVLLKTTTGLWTPLAIMTSFSGTESRSVADLGSVLYGYSFPPYGTTLFAFG